MTEKKTGRPTKYTESQVREAIKLVENAGEKPTGETVKKKLCDHFAVPPGVNAQSLDREVQRLLADIDRQRTEAPIAALPDTTRQAASDIAATMQAAMLAHLGEEHSSLRKHSRKKIAALEVDLDSHREQIRALEARRDEQSDELAALEQDLHDLRERLQEMVAENGVLKSRNAELEKEQDIRAEMFGVVKEALRQRADAISLHP